MKIFYGYVKFSQSNQKCSYRIMKCEDHFLKMMPPNQEVFIALLAGAVCVCALIWCWVQKEKEEDEARWEPQRCYGSSDHDDGKKKYTSRADAEAVINRMQCQGLDPMERLGLYYNPDYGKWFVGNRGGW